MKHLTEEELVLFYYGEGEGVTEHLQACEACRQEYRKLQRTLNAVDSFPVPERTALYEQEVWNRVSASLPKARAKRPVWRNVHAWGIAAALIIGAFLLGRMLPPERILTGPASVARTDNSGRVLKAAVGDHLERSQMVLSELMNTGGPATGTRDISYEQRVVEDLVDANRLFRVSADTAGDRATAALLDDLERVLLEIAHSPAAVSTVRFEELKRNIEDQGLLFKVRVYQTQLRERERTI